MFNIFVAESDHHRRACFALRASVYVQEKGWIPAQAAPDGLETDPHDSDSVHILAEDLAGNPAGTFRLILPSPERALPIEQMFNVVPPQPDRVAELSRLVVKPEYRSRSHVLMLGMCCLAFQEAQARGIEQLHAVVEAPLFHGLLALGFPFEQLGPERDVFGGIVRPTVCAVSDIIPSLAAAGFPGYNLASFFRRPFEGLVSEEVLRWTSDATQD